MAKDGEEPGDEDRKELAALHSKLQGLRESVLEAADPNAKGSVASRLKALDEATSSLPSVTTTLQELADAAAALADKLKPIPRDDKPGHGQLSPPGVAPSLSDQIEQLAKSVAGLRQAFGEKPTGDQDSKQASQIWLVVAIVLVLLVSVLGWDIHQEARTLSQLSLYLRDNAVYLAGFAAVFGALSGVGAAEVDGRASGHSQVGGLFAHGLLRAGTSALATLTIIGGAQAVEAFTVGRGPQVVFIGSGTVHRYLFGEGTGGLELPATGHPFGPHSVRFWAFEGESDDGLNFTAFAYDHHSQDIRSRVPLVGMVSRKLVELKDNKLALVDGATTYLEDHLFSANKERDTFAVLPLFLDRKASWFVAPGAKAPKEGLPALAYQEGKYWMHAPGLAGETLKFHLPGAGSGTWSSAVDCQSAPTNPEKDSGYKSVLQAWNFSLDLRHIDTEPNEVHLALGDFAFPADDAHRDQWARVPCTSCAPRDLSLVVPVSEGKEAPEGALDAYVCLALQVVSRAQDRTGATNHLSDLVNFVGCDITIANPEDCTCKLTPKGEELRVKDVAVNPREMAIRATEPCPR